MGSLTEKCDQYFYPNYSNGWDNNLFKEVVTKHLNEEFRVLDLGAGAGIHENMDLRGRAARIFGVDLDERVLTNPLIDEGKLGSADSIPYEDNFFDVVICNNVLEHLSDPQKVFGEVNRVLKKGGLFICKTPNKYHYVATFAKLLPHGFHVFYNKLRNHAEEDTFPTLYKVNSQKDLTKYAKNNSFEIESLDLIEGRPEYLRINMLLYPFGILYEKIVNSSKIFKKFRVIMLTVMRKT